MGCSQNGAMQGPGMVHRPRVRLCAAEGQHGAAWSHGTAQRLQVHKTGIQGPPCTIESLAYKVIPLSWY